MNNSIFRGMSDQEKQAKLEAALRCKTEGLLRDNEMKAIVQFARLYDQYSILVYRDLAEMFSSMIGGPATWTLLVGGDVVSSCDLQKRINKSNATEDAITVMTRSNINARRMIFIYIPKARIRKGRALIEQQRQTETFCA